MLWVNKQPCFKIIHCYISGLSRKYWYTKTRFYFFENKIHRHNQKTEANDMIDGKMNIPEKNQRKKP